MRRVKQINFAHISSEQNFTSGISHIIFFSIFATDLSTRCCRCVTDSPTGNLSVRENHPGRELFPFESFTAAFWGRAPTMRTCRCHSHTESLARNEIFQGDCRAVENERETG